MVNLLDILGTDVRSNSSYGIWLRVLFLLKVGSGVVKQVSEREFYFEGSVKSVFYRGSFNVRLELDPPEDGATTGRAHVTLNQVSADSAWYQTEGGRLAVNARFGNKIEKVVVKRGGDGGREIRIDVAGSKRAIIHLVPL